MKRTIMTCMLLAGMAAATFAQTEKAHPEKAKLTAEQRAEHQTVRLAKTISLTEAQKTSVYDVNLAAAKKMEVKRADNKEAWKSIHQEKDAQYKSILTAEQYQQYTAQKEEMRRKKYGKDAARSHPRHHQEMQHKSNH